MCIILKIAYVQGVHFISYLVKVLSKSLQTISEITKNKQADRQKI